MIRTTHNTVHVWANAEPDEISRRFHNMLIHEYDWAPGFRRMLGLFAVPAPYASGRYLHHDGYRA